MLFRSDRSEEQPAQERPASRGGGGVGSLGSALQPRTGRLSRGRAAPVQVLAGGGARRQRLRRPEPRLLLRRHSERANAVQESHDTLALGLGVMAGYFRGWVDEVIQYVYTLLSSIPDVLLIAAAVLLLQVTIDKHPELFATALERSDARLLFLCLILGITAFTGLCRLIRGEAMKLRELEYIQAARAFGVSSFGIITKHIVPNLMHIVLISLVMQFSGFVLAEAVLSYVGVGVDPKTPSFGVMINTARAELAATPVVWWTLTTAFVFMLMLVLSANLFSDAVRDAFDPRARQRQ